jgi:hypothetical protein
MTSTRISLRHFLGAFGTIDELMNTPTLCLTDRPTLDDLNLITHAAVVLGIVDV